MPAGTGYDIIEFFTKKSPCADWFKKAEIVEKSGAMVELFTPMKRPYLGNVLVVSDAAAFGECLYQVATACGYMAAQAAEKELKGKKGFEEYAAWWDSSFEWNRDPKRMADYTSRLAFPYFFTPDEIDFLFDLAKEHPIVVDEMDAGVYDYTSSLLDYFSSLPGVPDHLKEKMNSVKNIDIGKLAAVMSQVQE
jgi:flavin-dependent dehydrogenase